MSLSVKNRVYRDLAFLEESPENDDLIESYKQDAIINLQKPLEKEALNPPDLYDEDNYTPIEIILISYYTECLILDQYITDQSTGSASNVAEGNIEEMQTTTGKIKLKTNTSIDGKDLLSKCMKKMCTQAKTMGLTLAQCTSGSVSKTSKTVFIAPRSFFYKC